MSGKISVMLALLVTTFAVGCTEVTAPNSGSEKAITAYFWTGATPLALTYDLRYVDNNRVDRHEMRLESNANPHPLIDVSPLGSVTMTCTISDDEIRLSNGDGLGFFALPAGSYISGARPRKNVNGPLAIRAIAATRAGLFALTDAGDLLTNLAGDWKLLKSNIQAEQIEADSTVKPAIIYLRSGGTILSGTDSAGDFAVVRGNAGGTILNGKFTRFTIASNGDIFAVAGKEGIYRSEDHGETFVKLAPFADANINEIKVRLGGGELTVALGTDRGLYLFNPSSKKFVKSSLQLSAVERIALGPDHNIAAAGGEAIYISTSLGTSWVAVSNSTATGKFIAGFFNVRTNKFYFATSSGQLFGGRTSFGLVAATPDARTAIDFGAAYIASKSGLFMIASLDNASTPSPIGPSGTTSVRLEGELTLLKRGTNGIQTGNTWMAGFLAFDSLSNAIPLTARVIDRLDSLYINPQLAPKSETFVVRYGYEVAERITDGSPYWLIYFAKGEGPVMINQASATASGSTLNSQALRMK